MGAIPYAEAMQAALEGFHASGPEHRNCAQTMMAFAAMRLDAPLEVCEIARYLGGGIARQGLICGVLTGTVLALGLKGSSWVVAGSDRAQAPVADPQADLQALFRDFHTEFGGTDCRVLTGCDLSTPEGLAAFRESRGSNTCTRMLTWTMGRLELMLNVR